MNFYNLMYAADFYKVSHKAQYPKGVKTVHSTLVARSINYNPQINQEKFMWFGYSMYLRKLEESSAWFFKDKAVSLLEIDKYKVFLDLRLGGDNSVEHWRELLDLGSLPLIIYAQPEKSIQTLQKPLLTVENTHSNFEWLTSYIETSLLSNTWGVTTAANRAWNIRTMIEDFFEGYTDAEKEGIDFMCHDFSYRGVIGDEAAAIVGCGHLAVFKGSDTIPAIVAMEEVYGEITGFSVPATEHSVMCAGGEVSELDTYNRLLDLYPTGIVSIVSDTWDYFSVLGDLLPTLKDRIMARDGKLVIRPDSGNPLEIICGTEHFTTLPTRIQKGSLRMLDEVFGHTYDSRGLKVLDSHIGLIYGDGMTHESIKNILTRMVEIGYSPLNIVFGIGAFTYQYMTRDELGFAFKATAIETDTGWHSIQKNPKTDRTKKSLTGRFLGDGLELVYNGEKA